jgi:KUP system potassium uptake protein
LYYQENKTGDFRFLLLESFLSIDNDMRFTKRFMMKSFFNLKLLSVKEEVNFGLDPSNVTVEKYPLVVTPVREHRLIREQ